MAFKKTVLTLAGYLHPSNEKNIIGHLFKLALWVKVADSTVELTVGLLLWSGQRYVVWLAQDIAHLPTWLQQFLVFYLISHGLVKLFLVVSLFKEKMWAYPAFVALFAAFICYELYRYAANPSVVLLVLTFFDAAVALLAFLEYQRLRLSRVRHPMGIF